MAVVDTVVVDADVLYVAIVDADVEDADVAVVESKKDDKLFRDSPDVVVADACPRCC